MLIAEAGGGGEGGTRIVENCELIAVFLHGEQIVQEYERAVIYRLGRLVSGGAKGPGLFFILPCMDEYKKVDLRTVSFDVPPQEVSLHRTCLNSDPF